MSVVRIWALGVGSFLLIASTMARTAPGTGDPVPAVPEVGQEPTTAPAVAPNDPKPRVEGFQRGGAGVGVGGPSPQMQMAMIQQTLKIDDDAWDKLSPKVEKLLATKREMSTGAGINWTSRNGAKPVIQASNSRPDTAPGKAMQVVRETMDDEKATDEALVKQMTAVRNARKTARTAFEAAQKDLLDALTPRQQAILMMLGVVD